MKILYITQYYPPEIGAGPVRAEATINQMMSLGWEVDLVCQEPNYPTGDHKSFYPGQWESLEKKGRLTINRVKVFSTARRTRLEQMLLFGTYGASVVWHCIRNFRDYDLIFASSPPLSAPIAAALLSRLSGVPWVFEARDLWPDSMLSTPGARNSFLYRLLKKIEFRLYQSASLIIAVTEPAAARIRKFAPGNRVKVVTNGVNTNQFQADPSLKPKKTFRVGYIGSIGVMHDFEPVIKAAKLCEDDPEIEFFLIGEGSRSEVLRELISNYKPANLQWLGMVPHQQIPDYINTFSVGINPVRKVSSFESSVNVKFYEYLACEVPVINLGSGAIEEIGHQSGSAITLKPGDFNGLAQTIKRLKSQPSELESLKAHSRSFVEKDFNRVDLAKRVTDLIQNVSNENHVQV